MSDRKARFEIVRTAAGWHARFRASNGRVMWFTEVYGRKRNAIHAGTILINEILHTVQLCGGTVPAFRLKPVEVDER